MKPSFRRSFPIASLLVLLTLGVSHSPSTAKGAARIPLASPRVHPEASALFAHLARTGETLPTFQKNFRFEQTARLPVVVRFTSAPNAQKISALRTKGVTFDRDEPIASGAWLATVDETGLHALAADDDVARVTVDMMRRSPRPLDRSQEETTAIIAKRAAIAKDGKRLDGKGTVIADIDSPIWIHHPAFFRADGGAFAWVDVDGDKKLTPGKDGIDLDGNGTIEPNEVLHDLRSQAISRYTNTTIDDHETFTPELDYLYLDTNGNGERDHGPKGFTENTPAYGEPLFVFDDVNHDGETQTSERVLQLKTSKFRAIGSEDTQFTRGKSGSAGLLAYNPEADPQTAAAMGHGTGVAGILVGGVSGLSKWAGLAPEAELVVNDGRSSRGMVSSVQWAIDQKADVILTEYAPYTNVSLDGSSEDETILDAANDKGILTVSPAGNLAGGHKHRTLTLEAGTQTIKLQTDQPGRLVSISIHSKGMDRALTLKLKRPDGTTIDVPDSAPQGIAQPDKSYLYVMAQTTPRGTHERFVSLVHATKLDPGAYELSTTLGAGAPLEVDLFASDDITSWAGGFSFDQDTPTRTICSPSTSDKTISVAAFVLHDEPAFYPAGAHGDLASYSSRGPGFDGAPGIEIAAPDNPLSTAPPDTRTDGTSSTTKDRVLWEPFGGTSGAGPHVTAAVVLMKQALPNLTPVEIKKRLLDGAKPVAGGTEATFGKGKLDIAKALDAKVASGDAPSAKIEVSKPASPGIDAKLHVTVKDDEPQEALTARWDLDYDGTFDTEWLPLGDEQTLAVNDSPLGSKLGVKVEIRDGQGNINGTTALVEVVAPTADTPATAPTSTVTEDGCGCRSVGRGGDAGTNGTTRLFVFSAGLAIALGTLVRRRRS